MAGAYAPVALDDRDLADCPADAAATAAAAPSSATAVPRYAQPVPASLLRVQAERPLMGGRDDGTREVTHEVCTHP